MIWESVQDVTKVRFGLSKRRSRLFWRVLFQSLFKLPTRKNTISWNSLGFVGGVDLPKIFLLIKTISFQYSVSNILDRTIEGTARNNIRRPCRGHLTDLWKSLYSYRRFAETQNSVQLFSLGDASVVIVILIAKGSSEKSGNSADLHLWTNS